MPGGGSGACQARSCRGWAGAVLGQTRPLDQTCSPGCLWPANPLSGHGPLFLRSSLLPRAPPPSTLTTSFPAPGGRFPGPPPGEPGAKDVGTFQKAPSLLLPKSRPTRILTALGTQQVPPPPASHQASLPGLLCATCKASEVCPWVNVLLVGPQTLPCARRWSASPWRELIWNGVSWFLPWGPGGHSSGSAETGNGSGCRGLQEICLWPPGAQAPAVLTCSTSACPGPGGQGPARPGSNSGGWWGQWLGETQGPRAGACSSPEGSGMHSSRARLCGHA